MAAKSEEERRYPKLIGLLLVFASLLTIVVLYVLDITFLYEPKHLLGVTNTLFTTIIPLAVAFFAARTYLRTGSLSVLLMGCGMLGFGLCAGTAGWLIELQGGANFNVTVYNTGALLGSVCHFVGALVHSAGKSYEREHGRHELTAAPAYTAIFIFAVLLSFATVQRVVPPFFIQGSGPTVVRQIVLGLAIFLYAVSSLLFMNNYLRTKSDFLYWYSLCLAMLALGLFAFYIQKIVGSPVGWVGRTSNYAGTIFALIAILAAARSGKSRGLPLEEVIFGFFVDAEAGYRSLVETATDAIISFDRENRIILCNSGAEQTFGYSKGEAIGSPLFGMLIPEEHENTLKELIEASPGMSSQKTVEIVARHKNGSLFPIEISAFGRRVPNGWVSTCILRDITERRQAEEKIRHQNAIMNGINRIFREALTCDTEEDLGRTCLAVAEELTRSKFGFIDEIGADGSLHVIAISDPGWELCRMDDKTGHRRPPGNFKIHALYGRVLLDGKSLLTNHPSEHPDSIGTPFGHPTLNAFLGVPLFLDGQTIGIIGVGNREGGYGEVDREALEALSPTVVEVFARKRAEKALRESEARFRSLFDNMTEGVALHEVVYGDSGTPVDYRILTANPAFERHTGLSPEKCIGQLASSVYGMDTAPYLEEYARVADSGEPFIFETYFPPMERYFHISASSPAQGRFVTVFEDITEHKRMEEGLRKSHDELERRVQERTIELARTLSALADSEHRFREVLDNTLDVSYRRNLQTDRYDYISPAITSISGYTPEEMSNMSTQEELNLVHPDDFGPVKSRLEESLASEMKQLSLEYRFKNKDGLYRWFSDFIAIVRDTDGKPTFRVGTVRDITERKLTEQELRAYSERLELINQELQEFSFVAAHDLQEPLRKIQTFCDMAMKRCAPLLDNASRDYLDRVINSAERMRQLLRDLREYSWVAARPQPYKAVDLAKMAREAANVFEAVVRQTGGLIEIENIPTVEADESQMLRLLQNLIGNALKFRSDAAPHIRIYGKSDRHGICEICIKDNGIGFDLQFAEIIFKPFQRLQGRSEYDGTGMGLAICRKIVERHGGTISADSEPGKGSTFVIRLPVKQPGRDAIITRH